MKRVSLAGRLVLASTLLAPAALFAVEQLKFRPGFNLFSPKQDIEVGKQNAAEVDKQMPLIKDPQVTSYISDLGKKLTQYEPVESEYSWTFKVVNSRDINAFALPGGYIYVNRGAIESAENEAQLAGVLAHETGHVVMRHGTHQASQMMLAQMPLALLGGMLGQSSSLMSQLAQLGIGLGVNSIFLHNSRSAETQADQVGTYVLYHAGYNPHAMAEFFQIIEQKYPQRTAQFFSDHPNPENRIKTVNEEIPSLGAQQPGGGKTDSREFEAVKKKLLAMTPPQKEKPAEAQAAAPAQGSASTTDLLPSGNFRSYRHSEFTVNYPDNWEVYGDPNSAVTIAPRAGISENAVAFGAIINQYQPEGDRGTSLDAATHQLLEMLRQANSDLRVVGHDENVRVNGVRGKSVELIGPSPIRDPNGRPLSERDWLVSLRRSDGSLVYVIFISPDKDFNRFLPAFTQMLRSFRLR
jgi:Peptidase family M48